MGVCSSWDVRRSTLLVSVATVSLAIIGVSSSSAADTISALEKCSPKYGCSFSAGTYSMSAGESPLVVMPPMLDYPHDVTSLANGLDGRPLFESSEVGAGKSAVVNGAEYLPPGTYHFICSIHREPTIFGTRMEAYLVVGDSGVPPRPRPTMELRIGRQSLAQSLDAGALFVSARADQPSDQVRFILKAGKRTLSVMNGISVGPEGFQRIGLKLGPIAHRVLEGRGSAAISVIGAARYGEPAVLHRTLR